MLLSETKKACGMHALRTWFSGLVARWNQERREMPLLRISLRLVVVVVALSLLVLFAMKNWESR